MFKPFTQRRPWAAALIGFIFGPEVVMLYLGRPWYAIGYFLAFFVAQYGWIIVSPTFLTKAYGEALLLRLIFRIAAAAHGFFIARHRAPNTDVKWYARWYSVVGLALGLPIVAALTIRTFFYQPFDIPSASMEPTLAVGDYFFVSKSAYRSELPRRGDLVVFYDPDGKTPFVKRIVGLPGDHVQTRKGRLFINDAVTQQRKIEDWIETCDRSVPCHVAQYVETLPGGRSYRVLDRVQDGALDNTLAFTVPADDYFVLGDNRDNSDDSRGDRGFVSRTSISGRVVYRFIAGGKAVWQPVN